jgi:hypothetical protein
MPKVAMPEKFDPYHHWLGITPSEQPPHYCRLLPSQLLPVGIPRRCRARRPFQWSRVPGFDDFGGTQ